ncbi:unnamed protein product, partial [Cyprideis torosa]
MEGLQQRIRQQKTRIAEKTKELTVAQKTRDKKLVQMRKRVNAFYKIGRIDLLNITFSTRTLPQLLRFHDAFQSVVNYDKKLLNEYQSAVNNLARAKESLVLEQALLDEFVRQVESEKKEIQLTKENKTSLFQKISEQANLHQQAIDELEMAKQDLTGTMRVLYKKRELFDQGFLLNKGKLRPPVDGVVTSLFNEERVNLFGIRRRTPGITIAAPDGTPIQAVYGGSVVYADYLKGYGNTVIIDHGYGYFTVTSFIDKLLAAKGKAVQGALPEGKAEEPGDKSKETVHEKVYEKLELFANILSTLQDSYVEEINYGRALDGAISGMLQALDPHSSYLSPEDFQELEEDTQGFFSGIGLELTNKDGILTVIAPIEGGPAQRSGLKPNDVIVKINGEWTETLGPTKAVKKIRGPKGSLITLTIFREGWQKSRDITLIREIIPKNSVRMLMLNENICYARISTFQNLTTKDFITAFDELLREKEVKGMILDLRDNPGGLLSQAVSIADLFLSTGTIVYTKGRSETQNSIYLAHPDNKITDIPLLVLINEGSASAAEIVSGALQDQKRAILL